MSIEPSLELRLRRLTELEFGAVLDELIQRDPLELGPRVEAVLAREAPWLPAGVALAQARRAVARALSSGPQAELDAKWLDEQVEVAAYESTNHAAATAGARVDAWREVAAVAAARFGMEAARGFDVLTHFHALDRAQRVLLRAGMLALEQRRPRDLSDDDWARFGASFRALVRTLIRSSADDVEP